MALLSMMAASCFLFPDLNPLDPFDTLEEGFFYAKNTLTGGFYKLQADKLCEDDKCEIWAEKGSGVTITEAENIAREYRDKIRPMIVQTFGSEFDNGQDILDYANQLAGRDNGKLTILLLDIRDGFSNGRSDSYTAGYFYPGNFQPAGKINNNNFSNGRDMIYVDTYPGLRLWKEQAYATFAHELQHLVNYVISKRLGKGDMDVWVNEGLSAHAEYMYLGENPEDKCKWFNEDPNTTIGKGNNFFVWGNHSEVPSAIMDDYATVYLFFRWLYLQADVDLQPRIFREIIHSDYSDYRAVTSVAAQINPAWSSWEVLLRTWFAANYFPRNAIYGYKGDNYLQYGRTDSWYKGVQVRPIEGLTVPLYPGEGVYSVINNFYNANQMGNIRYAGLVTGNTGVINTSPPYSGNVLLTFNANSNKSAERETGSLTGISPSITVPRTAEENARPAERTRPFVIDAADRWGRDQDMPILLPR